MTLSLPNPVCSACRSLVAELAEAWWLSLSKPAEAWSLSLSKPAEAWSLSLPKRH